jgi:hypothetical protein
MSGNKPKAAPDTSRVEFFIEMKSAADPFDDHPSESRPFVRESGNLQTSLGQITIYATAILGVQYRTHVFSVIMVENYARLIRWDRSGTVVTEPIYYNKSPHLLDFLIRYGTADPQVRGHDSTVDQPTEDEIGDARTIVPELKDVESFLAITMPDQDQQRRFIISSPECRPHILVGRWTRASIALDTKLRRRVLLKDSWRVLLEDIEPEGVLYDRFRDEGVCNVPSCLLACDVGTDTHHRSQTDLVTDEVIGNNIHYELTPHWHYRIVLSTVGRRLEEFKSTREFVNAMYAALQGEMTIFLVAVCLCNLTHYSSQSRL